jgi:predicted PurR-regulated permease PerM
MAKQVVASALGAFLALAVWHLFEWMAAQVVVQAPNVVAILVVIAVLTAILVAVYAMDNQGRREAAPNEEGQ